MALKKLGIHNNTILEYHRVNSTYPKKNGLECPNCKQELYDRDSMVLCSIPAQKNIICLNSDCGYTGYAYI